MYVSNIKPVILDSERCNGCVNCMKRCPTEAIRVRNGKATVAYERCVGCGECVKVCPTKAKKEFCSKWESIKDFTYTVVVPSPSIYGQFNNLRNIDYVHTGLKNLGFDEVYEVAAAAEEISAATRILLQNDRCARPLIGSACPAVTDLILMRYEHLIDHLSPLKQPETVAAVAAREQARKRTKLPNEQIGVFVLTQCAANVFALLRDGEENQINGVLSFSELYVPLVSEMNKLTDDTLTHVARCGSLGVCWGCSTGEAVGIENDNYLAADGIENVIGVLDDLEHEKLNRLSFLELYACTSGCVGGSLNVENPFLARTRLRLLRKKMANRPIAVSDVNFYLRSEPYRPRNVYKLDDNRGKAMKKALAVKELYAKLPKINCGACGAPNCMAFAEDVVKGLNVECKYRKDAKV